MQTFTVSRLLSNTKSTMGEVRGPDGKKICSTVEDAFHEHKIPGQTRIPASPPEGYKLRIKPIGSSHFDAAYAKMFPDIYRGMIEIEGVHDFQGVLIHCGNTDLDTEGCLIVGMEITIGSEGYQVTAGTSHPAFKALYPILYAAIDAGDTFLRVLDEGKK